MAESDVDGTISHALNGHSSEEQHCLDIVGVLQRGTHREKRDKVHEKDGQDEKYGIGSWQPHRLQFMTSPITFVTMLCFFTSCVAFFSGIQVALLTTLETRYGLSSSETGFVITVNTIGTLFGLPVASYLGGRLDTHRPRWLAGGAFVMAVGMFVTCLPQFILEPYQYKHSRSDSTAVNDMFSENIQLCNNQTDPSLHMFGKADCTSSDDTGMDNTGAYVIILIGQFVAGIGYSPVKPLGISYIDDNVQSKKAGFYIGIISSMDAIGIVMAFLSSSLTSEIWVDFYRTETTLARDDPLWVSAWWLLYIFLAFILTVSGIPFLGFPKRLPRQWRNDDKDDTCTTPNIKLVGEDSMPSESKSTRAFWRTVRSDGIKEMFNSLWRLGTNRSYMLASFAYVTTGMITGLLSFFPKYMESQFGLSTSRVNVLIAIVIPALACGSIFGGYLCRRWNPNVLGLTKMCLVCACIAAAAQMLMFVFGCHNQLWAGVHFSGNSVEIHDMTSSCNEACNCASDVFQPVCSDASHVTYINPCFAGCKSVSSSSMSFGNCSCPHLDVDDFVSDVEFEGFEDRSTVHQGMCSYQCTMLVPFLITTVTCVFLISVEIAPLILTVVRNVEKRDKPFAFGITKFLQYIIGVIPTPVTTGALIDTTCRLWQFECGSRGACWVHDLDVFRSIIAGSGSVVIALQVVLLGTCWYILRGRPTPREGFVRIEVVSSADAQLETTPQAIIMLEE